MTIPHLKERIEYAKDELAWLEKGAPEGEEPWRGWEVKHSTLDIWVPLCGPVEWPDYAFYRRRPAMLHIIDAKGKRHEFPEPMREALAAPVRQMQRQAAATTQARPTRRPGWQIQEIPLQKILHMPSGWRWSEVAQREPIE